MVSTGSKPLALLRGGPADGIPMLRNMTDPIEYKSADGRVHRYVMTDDQERVGGAMLTVWRHQGVVEDTQSGTGPNPSPAPPSQRRRHPKE